VSTADLAEPPSAEWREVQPHHPVIVLVDAAPDQTGGFGPIDEPNRAVMAKQQRLGHLPDRRAARLPTSTDRQEELMLRRRQPCRDGLLLAPVQEATEARSELEEALIIAVGKLNVHIYIVTR
jgi:hypothetical protein